MNLLKTHVLNIFLALALALALLPSARAGDKARVTEWSIEIPWQGHVSQQIRLDSDSYQTALIISDTPIQTLFTIPDPDYSPSCPCDSLCDISGHNAQFHSKVNATLDLTNDCVLNNGTSVTIRITDVPYEYDDAVLYLLFIMIIICIVASACHAFRCQCDTVTLGSCSSTLRSYSSKCSSTLRSCCCDNYLTRRISQWKEDRQIRKTQQLATSVQSNMYYGDHIYNEL